MSIKGEFHQTKDQAHSLKKQSDSGKEGGFRGGLFIIFTVVEFYIIVIYHNAGYLNT